MRLKGCEVEYTQLPNTLWPLRKSCRISSCSDGAHSRQDLVRSWGSASEAAGGSRELHASRQWAIYTERNGLLLWQKRETILLVEKMGARVVTTEPSPPFHKPF